MYIRCVKYNVHSLSWPFLHIHLFHRNYHLGIKISVCCFESKFRKWAMLFVETLIELLEHGLEVIKLFFALNSAEHEISIAK